MTDGQKYAVVMNMSPVTRENFRMGLKDDCTITEVFNSDDQKYGGTGVMNPGTIKSEPVKHNQWDNSAVFTLPPFGTIVFEVKDTPKPKEKDKKSVSKGKKN